jgi:hypothetical protein
MKRLFILIIAFMTIGNYCKTQDLHAKRGANGKYGYIDEIGREIIPFKYDNAKDFSDGLAPVQLNGKWGYINRTAETIIQYKFDDVHYFFKGLAPVKLNGK